MRTVSRSAPFLRPASTALTLLTTTFALIGPPAMAGTGFIAGDSSTIENVTVDGTRLGEITTSRLPLAIRETPQSISQVSRELMDLASMTNVNDVLMNVTGINVSLYDTQRPLYFARGFQITDFQVDGIPTYSGSTNQEYDTALYERIEVIRGANGLVSGAGKPSATVNLIRKRAQREFGASLALTGSSWNTWRGVGDVSVPLTEDGRFRSRLVVAYQDGDSFRDRYSENKTAVLGVIEGDLADDTTLTLGYQNQDNNPTGTLWGTIPLFAADGTRARLPNSTSFAPHWTRWQRESGTLFANLEHRFNARWMLKAAVNRTAGDVFSLRVYELGFPDRRTGAGARLLAAVGAGEDTRDGLDLYVTGSFSAFGRAHDVVIGGNASRIEATTPLFTSIADWSYQVPDAWHYDGSAPRPRYSRTGAYRIATTEQYGVYASTRLRVTNALSILLGSRLSYWKTGTDNYDTRGTFTSRTGSYRVENEVTPYVGLIYDLDERLSLYASYTGVFNPQNYKDKHNDLLAPVSGSNLEAGLKGEFLERRLNASLALFQTRQDGLGVLDTSQPEGSLPDGTSAYVAVNGTKSKGVEIDVNGHLNADWRINAGYTYVKVDRAPTDLIWANPPEHYIQLSTHYRLPGVLNRLTVGGGINWQSKTVGHNVDHPLLESGATFTQSPFTLVNLHATWRFDEQLRATLSVTNALDETYWANIDYANYGAARNVSLTVRYNY